MCCFVMSGYRFHSELYQAIQVIQVNVLYFCIQVSVFEASRFLFYTGFCV
jgi:hypothetical protein